MELGVRRRWPSRMTGRPRVCRGFQQAASVSSTNAAEAPDTLIRFDHVTKLYGEGENRVHVVDDVSFTARRGEFISILGPSGCGKSTMLMLTSGLIPVSSGVIEIDGTRITEPYTDLGIVFQQDLLMDWRRVQANILVQAEFRGLRVKDYEKRARELLNSCRIVRMRGKISVRAVRRNAPASCHLPGADPQPQPVAHG